MRILVALLVVALAVPAGAQLAVLAKTTPQQRADAQTSYMKSTLSLTPEQTTKVTALNLEYAEKAEPILKGSAFAITKGEELRKLQDAKKDALKTILTPDQQATYTKNEDAMKTAVEAQLTKEVGAVR